MKIYMGYISVVSKYIQIYFRKKIEKKRKYGRVGKWDELNYFLLHLLQIES